MGSCFKKDIVFPNFEIDSGTNKSIYFHGESWDFIVLKYKNNLFILAYTSQLFE
jgi:hypothetical protein